MAHSAFETNPAFAKMNEDTRKAVAQAFDAMSNWRSEVANMTEKNSDAVFDKMAEAAKSLGWPTDFVEWSRKQIQSASKMQLQAADQVMDIWEKQLKSLGTPGQFPNFPNFPSFGGTSGFPQMPSGFPGMPEFGAGMNPMQFWMQAADMWQKNWQQAMSTWMDAQQNAMNSAASATKSNSRK